MDTRFSAIEVIGRTFKVSTRRAPALVVLVLLIYAPALVLLLRAGGTGELRDPWLGDIVQFLLSWFLAGLATGALTAGMLQVLVGRRPGFGSMVRGGIRRLPAVIMTSLWLGFAGAIAAAIALYPLFSGPRPAHRTQDIIDALVVGGAALEAHSAFWLAVPAVVVERGLGAWNSLGRSQTLTRGHHLALLGVFLLLWGILLVAFLAAAVILRLLAPALPGGPALAIPAAVSAIAGIPRFVAPAVAYQTLKVTKEGADPQQLAAVFE